jgi:putative heme-binding domain-containing protein
MALRARLPFAIGLGIILAQFAAAPFVGNRANAAEAEPPASLEQQLLAEPVDALAADARRQGDPHRGAELFFGRKLSCLRCHAVGEGASRLGPDLTRLPKDATPAHLVESVLAPSRRVRTGFESTVLATTDGTELTVFVVEETPEHVVVSDIGKQGRRRVIPRAQIDSQERSPLSIMPTAQVNLLADRREFLDLAAFLIAIAEHGPARAAELRPTGAASAPPPTAPDTAGPAPRVFRTLVPESGPASLAIGLGDDLWLVFDPNRGGINYAWHGGLDLSPTVAEKINQPASVEGTLFYRDAFPHPWQTADGAPAPFRFRGYRFKGDAVVLRYDVAGEPIEERLSAARNSRGFERNFHRPNPRASLVLEGEPQTNANIGTGGGRYTDTEDGRHQSRFEFDGSPDALLHVEPKTSEVRP